MASKRKTRSTKRRAATAHQQMLQALRADYDRKMRTAPMQRATALQATGGRPLVLSQQAIMDEIHRKVRAGKIRRINGGRRSRRRRRKRRRRTRRRRRVRKSRRRR